MLKLPVYLLLDTSGSMKGEPIESVKAGLSSLLSSLKSDPLMSGRVHLSIITFDREVNILILLTAIDKFQLPEITVPDSGPTHIGLALEVLNNRVKTDRRLIKGDNPGDYMPPFLFVMTDGSPSDIQTYRSMIPEIKNMGFGKIVGCAAGSKAKVEYLKELTDNVVSLDTLDSASFGQFFKWVGASINDSCENNEATIPPPPSEFNLIVV